MPLSDSVPNAELVHAYLELGLTFSPTLTRQEVYDRIIARLIEDPEVTGISKQALVTLYRLGCLVVDEKANGYQIT